MTAGRLVGLGAVIAAPFAFVWVAERIGWPLALSLALNVVLILELRFAGDVVANANARLDDVELELAGVATGWQPEIEPSGEDAVERAVRRMHEGGQVINRAVCIRIIRTELAREPGDVPRRRRSGVM